MTTARTRKAAAVLITVLSIALAEVSIGSDPWGLINPLQWVLLVPVYGAQTILVGVVVLRRRPLPTLAALWCAGVVMGLYEFYITRVLWDQPWDTVVNPHLVEVPALLVVAGFYHPFVSVIMPLLLAEQVLVREPTLPAMFPAWVRRGGRLRGWVWFATAGVVAGGGYASGNALVVVALVPSALVVWAVVAWAARAPKVETLAEALPGKRGIAIATALVVLVFTPFVALAQWGGDRVSAPRQIAALALYAAFVLLAWRNLRHAAAPVVVRMPRDGTWWLMRVGLFVVVAVASAPLKPMAIVAVVLVWGVGIVVAVVMLARSIAGALRRPRPPLASYSTATA